MLKSYSSLKDRLAEVPAVVNIMFDKEPFTPNDQKSTKGRDRSRSPLNRTALSRAQIAQLSAQLLSDLEEIDFQESQRCFCSEESTTSSLSSDTETDNESISALIKFKDDPDTPKSNPSDPLIVPEDYDFTHGDDTSSIQSQVICEASQQGEMLVAEQQSEARQVTDAVMAEHDHVAVIDINNYGENGMLTHEGVLPTNILSHMLQQISHDGSPTTGIFNFAVPAVKTGSLVSANVLKKTWTSNESSLGIDLSLRKDVSEIPTENMVEQLPFGNNQDPNRMANVPNTPLAPVLVDLEWFYSKPDLKLRDALGEAGVCATQLIMDALHSNPDAYHLKKEGSWFSKNCLSGGAVREVMNRVGVTDRSSQAFKPIYKSLQSFSGTYCFLKHSLDHGDFPPQLNELQIKAEELRTERHQNPERDRCCKIQEMAQSTLLAALRGAVSNNQQQQEVAEQIAKPATPKKQLAPQKSSATDKENLSSPARKNLGQPSPRKFGILQANSPRLMPAPLGYTQIVKQVSAVVDPQIYQNVNEKSPHPMAHAPQFF